MGVVLRVQRCGPAHPKLVLLIDDSTGVVRVEYPTINLTYALKQPDVGDLFDFLGEIHLDSAGDRFIHAYGMDFKKDGNWEALRYLEIVDLYRHHYYNETFEDHDMDVVPEKEDEEDDKRRLEEYALMSRGRRHGAPSHREEVLPFSQDRRILSSPPDSSSPRTAGVVLDDPPADHGAAIEAMLRQKGSATLSDIARLFPRCDNLVALLENLMLEGLLYEKEGRYYPL